MSVWCPVKSESNMLALGTSHNAVPTIAADFTYKEQGSQLEFCRFNLAQEGT